MSDIDTARTALGIAAERVHDLTLQLAQAKQEREHARHVLLRLEGDANRARKRTEALEARAARRREAKEAQIREDQRLAAANARFEAQQAAAREGRLQEYLDEQAEQEAEEYARSRA